MSRTTTWSIQSGQGYKLCKHITYYATINQYTYFSFTKTERYRSKSVVMSLTMGLDDFGRNSMKDINYHITAKMFPPSRNSCPMTIPHTYSQQNLICNKEKTVTLVTTHSMFMLLFYLICCVP